MARIYDQTAWQARKKRTILIVAEFYEEVQVPLDHKEVERAQLYLTIFGTPSMDDRTLELIASCCITGDKLPQLSLGWYKD